MPMCSYNRRIYIPANRPDLQLSKTAKNQDVPIFFFFFFFFFLMSRFLKKGGEIATDPVWTFNTLILSVKIVFPWPRKIAKSP